MSNGGLAKRVPEKDLQDSDVHTSPDSSTPPYCGTSTNDIKLRCKGNGMIDTCDRGSWNSATRSYDADCTYAMFGYLNIPVDCCTTCCVRPGEFNTHRWCEEVSQQDFTCVPEDCQSVYLNGGKKSGLYFIRPTPTSEAIQVWCDMETEGGGWTVIQRREDESVDFNRGWDEYEAGFGDPAGNYWMGLKNIHLLTRHSTELYVYLETFGAITGYARYNMFSIGDAASQYELRVGGFSGTAGDCMVQNNNDFFLHGMKFSTSDRDNDLSSRDCVGCCGGAWWHRSCSQSALNGRYFPRGSHMGVNDQGLKWKTFQPADNSIKRAKMMIRL